MCIFRLQSAYATQSRLMRELMHETIGLLNTVSDLTGHTKLRYEKIEEQEDVEEDIHMPDWHLRHHPDSDKSGTDSGVDSNDGHAKKSMTGGSSRYERFTNCLTLIIDLHL